MTAPTMSVFIWHRAQNVTDNFHPDAGIVALADSLEHARFLIEHRDNKPDAVQEGEEPDACSALTTEPNAVIETALPVVAALGRADLWIFPDAGCC